MARLSFTLSLMLLSVASSVQAQETSMALGRSFVTPQDIVTQAKMPGADTTMPATVPAQTVNKDVEKATEGESTKKKLVDEKTLTPPTANVARSPTKVETPAKKVNQPLIVEEPYPNNDTNLYYLTRSFNHNLNQAQRLATPPREAAPAIQYYNLMRPWVQALRARQVDEQKIDIEMNRLTVPQFIQWASAVLNEPR